MKNIYFLFLIVIVGISEKTFAQSRWVGIMPMQYNPSFAGNAGGHRLVSFAGYTSSKEREVRMKGNNVPFYKERTPILGFSYDNFIPKLASGIGFFATYTNYDRKSKFSDENYSGLKTGIVISPKISIKGKYTVAPSVGLTYKHLRYKYIFTNSGGNTLFKGEDNYDAFNLSAGLLFNTKKFYLGYSYYFNSFYGLNLAFLYEEIKQIQEYYKSYSYGLVQVGYQFQKSEDAKTSFTVQAVIRVDKYFEWADLVNSLNFTVKHKKLLFGVATGEGFNNFFKKYPVEDALYAGIGYQTSKFKIFYSQDLTNLKYRYRSELSLRLFIPNKSKVTSPF